MKLIILVLLLSTSLYAHNFKKESPQFYQTKMREFVIKLSKYAKGKNPNFIIVPNQGYDHVRADKNFVNYFDGILNESLFWTWRENALKEIEYVTSTEHSDRKRKVFAIFKEKNKKILNIDYTDNGKVENVIRRTDSVNQNKKYGYASFQGDIALEKIPQFTHSMSNTNIEKLNQINNFLYVFLSSDLMSKMKGVNSKIAKENIIKKFAATDYDLIVSNCYFSGDKAGEFEWFNQDDLRQLKVKKSGGKRLIMCYLSVGSINHSDYYWVDNQLDEANLPAWVGFKHDFWKSYRVQYWDPIWEKIIIHNDDGKNRSYVDRIIEAGFDGVILDEVAAYDDWISEVNLRK